MKSSENFEELLKALGELFIAFFCFGFNVLMIND